METTNYHHHHHHHSYREHERRKRMRKLRRLLVQLVIVVVAAVAFYVICHLYMNPEWLLGKAGRTAVKLENGVVVRKESTPHTRLDYNGIDVSHHQGDIDWQKLREDTCVKFVYIKATEGAEIVDGSYLDNVVGARRAGIPVGSYHYLTSGSTVEEQFENFYSVVNRHHQDIVPVVDVEEEGVRGWTKAEVRMNLLKMLRLIEEHYHCTPIIYSYSHFYNLTLAPEFNEYPLFLSRYEDAEPTVKGAGRHVIWQHTDQGIVNGINMPVDLDLFAPGITLADIRMPR